MSDAPDGRRLRSSPGAELPQAPFSWRATPGPARDLADPPSWLSTADAVALDRMAVRSDALLAGSQVRRFLWQQADRSWLAVALTPQFDGAVDVQVRLTYLPMRLTSRELDVLTLVATGASNKAAAAALQISDRTVSTHVEHLLAKLGQPSRAGLASVAVDHGWLRLPVPGSASARTPTIAAVPTAGAPRTSRPGTRRVSRPIIIGSLIPLTGIAADDGLEMLRGGALAVAELNARGGIGGRRVEHLVVDADIFEPSGVTRAFDTLADAGVDAVTNGYVFAEDAVRESASAYGAPFLHATTSEYLAHAVAEDWTRHATIFQTSPTERHYGLGFVRAITDIRRSRRWRPANRRLVFVESSLPSSQMINDITIDAADRWGWEIAADPLVVDAGADWDQVVAAIDRLDPAAVMVTQFFAREVVRFALASARADVPWLRYAVYAPSVPEFLHGAGAAAEGMLWSTVTGTYGDAIGRAFEADYSRSYSISPGRAHAGISYDQVMLLGQAFGAVGDPGDHTAVCAHIRRSRMRGVNGSYFLDNPEQCALGYPDLTPDPSLGQAHLIFQVQQGRSRIIAPTPYAEASYQAPSRRQSV